MPSKLSDRLQYLTVRFLAHLPDALKIRLSGQPPIVVDGQQLDPLMQLLHTLARRRHTYGLVEPTVEVGRWRYRRQAEIFRGPMTPVDAVQDFEIPGPAGPLRIRHYSTRHDSTDSTRHYSTRHQHQHQAPSTKHPAPLTVYFHGGGFVIGDLDTHDEPCRFLCRHVGVDVLSVAYRCAPEHPFPAAVEDAMAAFAWARANASPSEPTVVASRSPATARARRSRRSLPRRRAPRRRRRSC